MTRRTEHDGRSSSRAAASRPIGAPSDLEPAIGARLGTSAGDALGMPWKAAATDAVSHALEQEHARLAAGTLTDDTERGLEPWAPGRGGTASATVPDSVVAAVIAAVRCGGDSETEGANARATAGAGSGPAAIPARWTEEPEERERGRARSEGVARRLAERARQPVSSFVEWRR